ncbi:hypothetical protein BDZ91DRAFT_270002 [Kalaharituber pfeilii]|nr:hypothetical protein BDZ91DRAFT_270002 [Kalaharituber pfeilii]
MARGFRTAMSNLFFLFTLASIIGHASGHIQMHRPYPLRSPLNPSAGSVIDYDMRSPLAPDGSNFPCKGYHKGISDATSVEKYQAGKTYQMTLEGSAFHGGGSCQLSLSYDAGATFEVIHSMIGGCPLNRAYDFTIPATARNSEKVLFAWTWFNRIGNREMYMNCAVVDIVGGSGTFHGPPMFKANIFGSTCVTKEGEDIVFPNPGSSSVYGGNFLNNKPVSATVVEGCPSSNTNGGRPPPEEQLLVVDTPINEPFTTSTSAIISTLPPNAVETVTTTVTETITKTHTKYVTITLSDNRDQTHTRTRKSRPTDDCHFKKPAEYTDERCNEPEAIQCYADGMKWRFCDGEFWVDMNSVANGTKCVDSAMVINA